MLAESNKQYGNKNLTRLATILHKKFNPVQPTKSCNFATQRNPCTIDLTHVLGVLLSDCYVHSFEYYTGFTRCLRNPACKGLNFVFKKLRRMKVLEKSLNSTLQSYKIAFWHCCYL